MDIFAELEKLRMTHHICHDNYYSCPKTGKCEDSFANKSGECDCGAEEHNKTLDGIIEWLKRSPSNHIGWYLNHD